MINLVKSGTKSSRRNEKKRRATLQKVETREIYKRRNRNRRQQSRKNSHDPKFKVSRRKR